MSEPKKRSSAAKARKSLDVRVEDLRKRILHRDLYSGWFPVDATKKIVNVVDDELEPIGEPGTGSGGLVQLALLLGSRFVRISY